MAGTLRVDGGRILLTDPVTVADRSEGIWEAVAARADEPYADLAGDGFNAVSVSTAGMDGDYQVEALVFGGEDGTPQVAEVRVRFAEIGTGPGQER